MTVIESVDFAIARRYGTCSSPLRWCMTEGLVAGEGFAIDASVIKADANRARGISGTEVIDWRQGDRQSRAVREYLEALEQTNPSEVDAPMLIEHTRAAPMFAEKQIYFSGIT